MVFAWPPAANGDASSPQSVSLLLIEDDDLDAVLLENCVAEVDEVHISVRRVDTLSAGLSLLARKSFHVIVLDLSLPDARGDGGLDRLIEADLDTPIIVLTGHDDIRFAKDLIRAGAQDFIPKAELASGTLLRSISHSIERHALSRELRDARREADAASSAKSAFVASVSHEIRTPMNAILGMANLLERTALDDQQLEYVQIFQRSGKSLLSLINNVLDMSKIESGSIAIEQRSFDLVSLCKDAAETFAFDAHEKGLGFCFDVRDDVPSHCKGDPVRLRQVLANLLGNAVKFTEAGDIRLTVGCGAEGMLRFEIEDTGIGVVDGEFARLFEPFEQGGELVHRRFGGTGLGLSLCRDLVELMGGVIRASRGSLGGSRFEFELPFEFETVDSPARFLAAKRILLALKHSTERDLLSEQMARAGAHVESASNVAELLARLADPSEGGPRFDSIVLDARFPGSNELRPPGDRGPAWPEQTVLLLPLDHREGDTLLGDENGYRCLVKPISHRTLLDLLEDDSGPPQPSEEQPAAEATLAGKRILLVDDSEDNRIIVLAYLAEEELEIDCVEDGSFAIRQFIDAPPYDLILMDMQMPVVDGYEATQEIRRIEQQEGRPPVPIVALTADAFTEHRERAREVGCDDHVTKPVDQKTLVDVATKWTQRDA